VWNVDIRLAFQSLYCSIDELKNENQKIKHGIDGIFIVKSNAIRLVL
jgi:hypothetical protein